MFQQSDHIDQLATAFAAFQAEIKNPSFDAKNPFFGSEYVTLAGLQEHYRPILASHGLSISQWLGSVDFEGDHFVTSCVTQLQHVSGQWQRSSAQCVVNRSAARDGNKQVIMIDGRPVWLTTPQDCGGADSYLQRYAYMAVIGVRGEKDDDGNAASGLTTSQPRASAPGPATTPSAIDRARQAAPQAAERARAQEAYERQAAASPAMDTPDGGEDFVPLKAVNELTARMKALGWGQKQIDAYIPNPQRFTDTELDRAVDACRAAAEMQQTEPPGGGGRPDLNAKMKAAMARIEQLGRPT